MTLILKLKLIKKLPIKSNGMQKNYILLPLLVITLFHLNAQRPTVDDDGYILQRESKSPVV